MPNIDSSLGEYKRLSGKQMSLPQVNKQCWAKIELVPKILRLLPELRRLRFILVASLTPVLCCCSQISSKQGLESTDAPIISTPQSPFQLQVTLVDNNGQNLRVEGVIVAKAAWNIDQVSIGLVGYKDGIEVTSARRALKEFANPLQLVTSTTGVHALPEQTPLAFSLNLPSAGISDYQITLGWGQDAQIDLATQVRWEQQGVVDIGADPKCELEDCPHYFAVDGNLLNMSSQKISAVRVALRLRLAGTSSESEPEVPTELNEVNLEPLTLNPGGTQKVRLRFKTPIDPDLAGKIVSEVLIKGAK